MSAPIPGVRYVYDGTAFVAPGRPSLTATPVVAVGEIAAVISAYPEQEAATRAVLAELGWTTVWWYAASGKTLNAADANGKTTVQNIAQARTDITDEPTVWILDVEQGAPASGAASQASAILSAIGTTARQVTWIGGGYPNASPNATVDTVRGAVEPLVTAHQNALYSEWRYYIQCHNDTRDKITGAATSWWTTGTTLSSVGVQRKIHHTYRVQVGPPLSKPDRWWNPTDLAAYTSPTRVGTTYTDIRTIPGYSASKSLKDNLTGLTTASVVYLPSNAGSGPNGEHEIVNMGAPWLGGIRLGAAGTGGNTLVRGFRGDDPDTSKIKLRPWSSTFGPQVPTTDGAINPFGVIQVSGVPQFELTNVGLYGSPQGHDYHGLTIGENASAGTPDVYIDGCKFVGLSKGSDDQPPGECMALRINYADDVWITNSEFDGRFEDTGEIASASMIAFNGPGSSLTNPANHSQRAHIENIWYHDGFTGMLTFWLWDSATTINFWSDTPGGVEHGTGWNHEEAGSNGRPFLHYNPSLLIRGYYESLYSPHLSGTNTANRSQHWSMLSGNHNITNLRVYFIRPDDAGVTTSQVTKGVQYKRHDRGPGGGSGTYAGLGIHNGNNYPAGVANSNQALGADVKVFKTLPGNVVRRLTAIPYTAAPGQTGDTAVVYYR